MLSDYWTLILLNQQWLVFKNGIRFLRVPLRSRHRNASRNSDLLDALAESCVEQLVYVRRQSTHQYTGQRPPGHGPDV